MNKKQLKELIKGVIREQEDSNYQEFFKKALEKAGKSIPEMSDEEKKEFFNRIDAAWDTRTGKEVTPSDSDDTVTESKFYVFYNNTKREIEANDLWGAKKTAIALLKIPKSKQGLLAVMSKDAYDAQQFKYETVTEASGNDAQMRELHKILADKNFMKNASIYEFYSKVASIRNSTFLRYNSAAIKQIYIDYKKDPNWKYDNNKYRLEESKKITEASIHFNDKKAQPLFKKIGLNVPNGNGDVYWKGKKIGVVDKFNGLIVYDKDLIKILQNNSKEYDLGVWNPDEKAPVKMNNLDWGKSTAERNTNLDKYHSLKTDKERQTFLKKLKGESVNEVSRRAVDFYGDSKHGKSLHSLLKGKWDSKKVENYLETLGDGSDVKYVRLIDFISKDSGLNTHKYKTIGEQLSDLMKQLEVLYKDFLTEPVNEATTLQQIFTKIGWAGDSWTPKDYEKQIKDLPDSTLKLWYDSAKNNKGVPNTPLAFQQKLTKIEMEKRGFLKSVNEAKVIVYNEKTGERYEVLSGSGKGDLLIAMKALQKAAPSHMKYSIRESVNEGFGTIALGVAGGLLLLKILKFVAKKVVGAIGINVKLPKEKLLEVLEQTIDTALKAGPTDIIGIMQLHRYIESEIVAGKITTIKQIVQAIDKASK